MQIIFHCVFDCGISRAVQKGVAYLRRLVDVKVDKETAWIIIFVSLQVTLFTSVKYHFIGTAIYKKLKVLSDYVMQLS